MKAWLITWEWDNDAAAVADRIAGILTFRFSEDRIERLVEFLYAQATSTVGEMASYARERANNPYRAKRDVSGQITCGHNPYLLARQIKGLEVTPDSDGFEHVKWIELPIYRPADHGPEQVRGDLPQETHRRKRGAVSSEGIWDRLKGGFKDGWDGQE